MKTEKMQLKLYDEISKQLEEIFIQRDEILRAFIAKNGCDPDETEQIVEHSLDGGFKWKVRKKEDE